MLLLMTLHLHRCGFDMHQCDVGIMCALLLGAVASTHSANMLCVKPQAHSALQSCVTLLVTIPSCADAACEQESRVYLALGLVLLTALKHRC